MARQIGRTLGFHATGGMHKPDLMTPLSVRRSNTERSDTRPKKETQQKKYELTCDFELLNPIHAATAEHHLQITGAEFVHQTETGRVQAVPEQPIHGERK